MVPACTNSGTFCVIDALTSPHLKTAFKEAVAPSAGTNRPATVTVGGRITVKAPIININGVVQSGRDRYEVVLGNDARDLANSFPRFSGRHVIDVPSTRNSGFRVTYDTALGRFELTEIATRGGSIELYGTVASTGAGELRILGGFPVVLVTNTTGKELVAPRHGPLAARRRPAAHPRHAAGLPASVPGNPGAAVQAGTRVGEAYTSLYQWTEGGVRLTTDNGLGAATAFYDQRVNKLVAGIPTDVFALPTYQPNGSLRYGWMSLVQIAHKKYKRFSSTSLFGISWLTFDRSISSWDRIEVTGQPRIPSPGGSYFYTATSGADTAYTYSRTQYSTGRKRT